MKSTWTAGMTPDKVKEFKADFKGCPATRERLEKILQDKVDTTRKYARSREHLSDMNWDRMVAHSLGYEAAMYEIMSLLKDN